MSFYLRALRHGVLRLFTLPSLSLPILITLSFTLAAVLVVVAMSSNLIFKPLPDIKDEQSLYTINRTMAVSDDMRVSIFTTKRLALLAEQYKQYGIGQTLQLEGQSLQVRGVVTDFSSFLSETDEKYAQQIWLYYNLAEQVSKPTQMTIDGSLQPLFRKTQQAIPLSVYVG